MSVILVVEDDRDTNEAVSEYLKDQGYQVISVFDGDEALAQFESRPIDLVVLDIMIPKLSGLGVLRALRTDSTVPVLMLTALGDEHIQVASFDGQADDYMTKPFSLVLLGRRIAALLRRASRIEEGGEVVHFGDVTVDFGGYTAYDSHGRIDITPKEIALLRLLTDHRGQVLTRSRILDNLWGEDYPILDRTIDTHISNLRKKLHLECVVTVKGVGYKFEVES